MIRRDGYVVDIPYPLHFYKEVQPVWLAYIVRSLGCVAPDISRPYSYCELGCGAGTNILVAAAANPLGRFVGVDFNEKHIAYAQSVAHQAGIDNVEFVTAAFDELVTKESGRFDFIASHGVWSWLPPKAQLGIMRFVHERLNPQGVLYLHYMCFPGAARLTAMQKLLHEVSLATQDASVESIGKGLALLRKLAEGGAGLFVDNPEIEKELTALEKELPSYLAHDFLTDFWQPQHSADLHRIVSRAGVNFIGSANCFENMDALSIPGNVQPLLADASSRGLRETIKDIARNQNQRVDIFQKEPRSIAPEGYLSSIDGCVFKALPKMPEPGELSFETPIGAIPGPSKIFGPLMERLKAEDSSFAQLRQLPVFESEPGLLLQALHMLMWAAYAHPVRPDKETARAAKKLESWISEQGLPLRMMEQCGTAAMIPGAISRTTR